VIVERTTAARGAVLRGQLVAVAPLH